MMIARMEEEHRRKLKACEHGVQLENLIDELSNERREWDDWLREIESDKLEHRGRKIGVYVEDFDLPDGHTSHYDDSMFGNRYLSWQSLTEFRKAVRAREPVFRKERREFWALWLQVIVVLSGLIGTITGLVVVLKR